MPREIMLVTLSGPDRPGLFAAVSDCLALYDVIVLDVSQAVVHNTLSLSLLIEIPENAGASPVLKDLLFTAHGFGVHLTATPITQEEYERWVNGQGKKRHIVTLLGRRIRAGDLAAISRVIRDNDLNIESMTRLSGRGAGGNGPEFSRACVEILVRGTPRDLHGMRRDFLEIARERGVDIGLQEDNAFRRNRRLVAFDMDSTLIQAEVIDELAKRSGAGEEVARITEQAMRGELDFSQSLERRVALLKGLPESVLCEVADTLPLTEGAERLISVLKSLGYKIAILSGGFTFFGERLRCRLGIDYMHANELEIRGGRLTGRIVGKIVDGRRKASLLREIAAREGIDLMQVIAVGDGANDLPMLDIAGLGIAFRAKPVVKAGAKQSISVLGLDGVLYFIGIRDRETGS